MKTDKKYIWDYDIKSINLKNPQVLVWYLSRKVNSADWDSLDTKLIERHIDQLVIKPSLRQMLKRYYADKRTKKNS